MLIDDGNLAGDKRRVTFLGNIAKGKKWRQCLQAVAWVQSC